MSTVAQADVVRSIANHDLFPGAMVGRDRALCRVVTIVDDAFILKPVVAPWDEVEAIPVGLHELGYIITRGDRGNGMCGNWSREVNRLVAVDTHADGSFTVHKVADVRLGDGVLRLCLHPVWHNQRGKLDDRQFECDWTEVTLFDGSGRMVDPHGLGPKGGE